MTFENVFVYEDYDGIKSYYLRIDDSAINKVVRFALGEADECVSSIREHCEKSIAYWCDLIKAEEDDKYYGKTGQLYYDENDNKTFDITHHISRGGKLVLHNIVDNKNYDLTRENLTYGIKEAAHNYICQRFNHNINKFKKSGLFKYNRSLKIYELDNIDFNFADEAIQFAFFNDLYYSPECLWMHGMIRIYVEMYKPMPE